eukprot:13323902-Alexandrium_andersonii.AAC.1
MHFNVVILCFLKSELRHIPTHGLSQSPGLKQIFPGPDIIRNRVFRSLRVNGRARCAPVQKVDGEARKSQAAAN